MSFTFDFRDVDRMVRKLQGFERQIPFALAMAMNKSADVAMRQVLPEVWAEHIRVRNPNFLKQALSMKGAKATKRNLRVEVYDRFGRGNLALHDKGGMARGRGPMAIPSTAVAGRRSAKGVPKGLQPRNLPNSFVTDGRRPNTHLKQGAIYQRQGEYHRKGSVRSGRVKPRKNKDGHLVAADARTVKLMYVLKPENRVPADVPFHQEFNRAIKREMPRQFSIAMRKAMATAFRK